MRTKYLKNKRKRKAGRCAAILLVGAMVFHVLQIDGAVVSASEKQVVAMSLEYQTGYMADQADGQKKVRTEVLRLSEEEQENPEEGWSWKKDSDDSLSYTLTLDHVNFQVSDNSAISLYAHGGFRIRFINIILKGENQLVSTNPREGSIYDCCGIYFDYEAYSGSMEPAVSIQGNGSLLAEGGYSGICLPGALNIDDVTINACSDGTNAFSAGGNISIKNSNITTNTIHGNSLYVKDSSITATLNDKTQGGALISTKNLEVSGSTLNLEGCGDQPTYNGISCYSGESDTFVTIKDSRLDIRNVEYGISTSNPGKIILEEVTGALFCSNTSYLYEKNAAFFSEHVDVADSEIYAQAGNDILIYGDCALPKEIKELTVAGDLTIEGGKSFTIGEDQKITFTKDPAKISNPYYETITVVNNGILEFQYRPTMATNACLENNGTLLAEDGLNCQSVSQFTNKGTYNGIAYEHSGCIEYCYGNVTKEYNRTLGGAGVWLLKSFVMPDAVLVISDGKTLDATKNGITWENLDEFLAVREGGKIIVEEGGKLLLPANVTEEQLSRLNLSGKGTVQIGDSVLYKVSCWDGDTLLYDGFANNDNTVPQPAMPTKKGYTFRGWYTEAEGGTAFDFSMPVDANLTLYAQWDILIVDVVMQDGSHVSVKGNRTLTYGQKLSELELNPAVFVEQGTGTEVSGTLAWKNPSDTPQAGTISAEWVFLPDNIEKYTELAGTAVITVEKAIPEVEPPTLDAITYDPSVRLDSLEFKEDGGENEGMQKGIWNWKDGTIVPTVGNSGYKAVFTPEDTDNYDKVEVTINLTVIPAENAPNMPPAAMDVAGSCEKVSNVPLPQGWNWQDGDGDIILEAGAVVKAIAVYNGADKGNYKNESVIVSISRPRPVSTATPEPKPSTDPKPDDTQKQQPPEEKDNTSILAPKVKDQEEKSSSSLGLNAGLKVSQSGRNISISWGKVSGADGYDIYVQYCGRKFSSSASKTIKSGTKIKTTIKKINKKKLRLKKNYKIRVVAYRLENGRKVKLAKSIILHIVGINNKKYTNVKAVRVKKNSYTLKTGSTARIKVGTVLSDKRKKLLSNAHGKKFRYASSNRKVATVSSGGKIRAVGKGFCQVYVYARNGHARKIKVEVR